MGQHFVPQAYLRAFQDPSQLGSIWTLPRGETVPRLVPIKKVAQSRGFYDPEQEVELARLVERPANPLLERLRNRGLLTPSERLTVAVYIATMMKRVPKNRERGERLLRPALDSTVREVRAAIKHISSRGALSPELVERHLREVDEAYEKFSRRPPESVVAQMNDPRPTVTVVQAILSMTWRVLIAPPNEFFITSDNPAFFHGAYGVGTPNAELRFPLSPELALHGTWQPDPAGDLSYHHVPKDWIREFNRAIASDASALVFCHQKVHWLKTLLHRKEPYLFRLVWTK